jgi:hypothetical protein
MQISGKSKAFLRADAKEFINLYAMLGERSENFLPGHIFEKIEKFVRLCYEQPDDPAKQQAEIDKQILELKEAIPGYVDVSLMLFPHEDSKAFQYRTKKLEFSDRLTYLIDNDFIDAEAKKQAQNILNSHDYSIGTPPVTKEQLNFLYNVLIGDHATELRKFRDVIGVRGDENQASWNYLLDVLDQMVVQSSHYTTVPEKRSFLDRTELTVNFKGLSGFIRTIIGGGADTAIKLIAEEVFRPHNVRILEFKDVDTLYEDIKDDFTNVFVVKVKSMRRNIFSDDRWFRHLTRLIFVDDSAISLSTNTSLVFCFHNGIINTLNKVHTKKLGSLANSQTNLRLILDKISPKTLVHFKDLAEKKIADYDRELALLKNEQLGETENLDKDIVLFKFDDFSKQILKDKYAITKLRDYLTVIINTIDPQKLVEQNLELISEFEERIRAYFYSGNKKLHISTIVEGGGRNQIKTYGEYLLQRKLKSIDPAILKKCHTILDIIPTNYERTLKVHFHKNFGINLFLEKYKEYLTKAENEADNRGRFKNFLIDLGIKDKYDSRSEEDQNIIKAFISDLGNLDKTSISDDVQMIIRDIIYHKEEQLRPYILYNQDLSWEYQDLFPPDRFDLNPFDLEIGMDETGHIDFDRLTLRLTRMKSTFQLFDDTGSLWDRFCENLSIVINDPSNPSGYTDFNNESLIRFLKFISAGKITLFLDEAYSDSVKLGDTNEPKWRTISRYVMNNIGSYANISVVSSLSTTKNLSGTGHRLGALVASPARKEVIVYTKKLNSGERCNTNSVYMLVNLLEVAQSAKKLKDAMEANLPKNASLANFRKRIEEGIKSELKSQAELAVAAKKIGKEARRYSMFEGSPLHIYLLEELNGLDKLDVLNLPDDFKYKNRPFFKYYQEQLLKSLNKFRINKFFLNESNKRLLLAKEVALEVMESKGYDKYAQIVDSDGSYLFNVLLSDVASYQGLEKFTKKLAEQRGIALIPYKIGFVRFSVGGYLEGSQKSYDDFRSELRNAIEIFFKYWVAYQEVRHNSPVKNQRSEDILEILFQTNSDKEFINKVLDDFYLIKTISKPKPESLKISTQSTIYQPFTKDCGVNISGIESSKNSVFEFYENIGDCQTVSDFIQSRAFTKIYENLLAQVYKNIPALKSLDFNTVVSKYGKPTLFKYIENKLSYQPNSYVLDNPDELNIMKEILIELERILFSDTKFKIMVLEATDNVAVDRQRLEGVNAILKKHVKELLLHFNLPFANEGKEPSIKELVVKTVEKFEEITGKPVSEFGLKSYIEAFVRDIRTSVAFRNIYLNEKTVGVILNTIFEKVVDANLSVSDKLLNIFLLKRHGNFEKQVISRLSAHSEKLLAVEEGEARMISEELIFNVFADDLNILIQTISEEKNTKISQENLGAEVRKVSLMFIDIINRTKSTEYYDKYAHTLIKFVDVEFRRQYSAINEMVQHGITLYRKLDLSGSVLETYENGALSWLNDVMEDSGVIAAEQAVQTHTRISTDAKKREYPFHKIDRTEDEERLRLQRIEASKINPSPNDYIKNLATKPKAEFFADRLRKFVEIMDKGEYRCKITDKGLIKELVIFHKAYIKYLADNFRLLDYEDITFEQAKKFVPDVVMFLGVPEKVISFPQIGYFDLKGPNGKIKTFVTPLKKEADYFGDVKKPRLTMINEKVKEMGGIPIHGSMFAVEEEDGGIFVVHIGGDSGVGKSEMLAALMLKWLRKDLTRIRSIKLIAGDMFHIFPDKEGNLYGIGTEVGDFSRVTDFDPDYIRYYNSLFESAADSNAEDLNSRSTISGLCDITMPYKIDIMLTASNYARQEAGIIRHDNPENYLLYRDSHGERKEKATSGDMPSIQRSLLRYTADPAIVSVLDKHGNYLDEILDWEKDDSALVWFLCSSYKMIDKIDLEDIVRQIFKGKKFEKDGRKFDVSNIEFDVIKNRFNVLADDAQGNEINFRLDRKFFSQLFNALASTPSGQPFISEDGQIDGKNHILNILKGKYGKGNGSKIQLGTLSTDLGKKGREISGPQMAAEELKKLIQEVRIGNPEINSNKQEVRNIVHENYNHIFNGHKYSPEIHRYNFVLWQIEQMCKADFVRIDDMKTKVDLSKLKGFHALPKNHEFSPLLVTPNINKELNGFSETYMQLIGLPDVAELAEEFTNDLPKLYRANGYSQDTIVNNMVLQLLLMHGYMTVEDLNRGHATEKTNRETVAAAKWAVTEFLKERDVKVETPVSPTIPEKPLEKPETKKNEGKKK